MRVGRRHARVLVCSGFSLDYIYVPEYRMERETLKAGFHFCDGVGVVVGVVRALPT